MADSNHVKVLFRFFSPVLEEETVETMWATIVNEEEGLYKLDNIPFYARGISSDDILFAEFDKDEERLTFREIVEFSGNSTIRVVRLDKTIDKNDIRAIFDALGCVSEGLNEGYFAMEVPASVNYEPVKKKLEELKYAGSIDYEESCLSEQHQH